MNSAYLTEQVAAAMFPNKHPTELWSVQTFVGSSVTDEAG